MAMHAEMALPIGVATLTDQELAETNGGEFIGMVAGALLIAGVMTAVVVGCVIIGGVVYALTH